jgi:hypothetical protein
MLVRCMSLPHVDPGLFSAFATLVVGLSVAFIALQQWILARHRFRLDLFDKRYKVYEATAQFLAVIIAHANFEDEDLRVFTIGTRDATFLFPKQITDHIHRIRCRAIDMRLFQTQFERLHVGEERSRLVEKNSVELKWLLHEMQELSKTFKPWLGFERVR